MRFLEKPADIRKAIRELQRGKRLDIAVAFVGDDWSKILSDYSGELRLICWLSSTNTNPYAVETLKERPLTDLRQRHMMHCKVYLAPSIGAVVGSANLSKTALSANDAAGQDEAAMFVSDPATVAAIASWFERMWCEKRTEEICESHIALAKAAYDRARIAREQSGRNFPGRTVPVVPSAPRRFSSVIRRYAKEIREINLRQNIGTPIEVVASISPETVTNSERNRLVDTIVSWTRHPGVYKKIRRVPLARFRKGLQLLFDESVELQLRLDRIIDKNYLSGLRMRSLSLLLYWKYPEKYPPFNHRTSVFLTSLGMRTRGLSHSSPRSFSAWLRWATLLSERLDLPTRGHVDRLVDLYYARHHQES